MMTEDCSIICYILIFEPLICQSLVKHKNRLIPVTC